MYGISFLRSPSESTCAIGPMGPTGVIGPRWCEPPNPLHKFTRNNNIQDETEFIAKFVLGDINILETKYLLENILPETIAITTAFYYKFDDYIVPKDYNPKTNSTCLGDGAVATENEQIVIACNNGKSALKTTLKIIPLDEPEPIDTKLQKVAYWEIIINGKLYKIPLYS